MRVQSVGVCQLSAWLIDNRYMMLSQDAVLRGAES